MEKHILKYLHNELTKAEEYELKLWLQKDEENRKVFENVVGAWKLPQTDVDTAKARVLNKIKSENPIQERKDELVQQSNRFWRYALRVAAVVVFTLATVWVVNNIKPVEQQIVVVSKPMLEKRADNGQKVTFELPDGSNVKLNAGSVIRYPSNFDEDSRTVMLSGEAFFDVERDEQRPFSVLTDGVNVKVLGTSFNVKAYEGEKRVEVAVRSGKVAVESSNGKMGVSLLPNEMATYLGAQKDLKKEVLQDEHVFAWVEKKMVFKDSSIDEILRVMARWYDVEFVTEKELNSDKKFTAQYNNLSLKAVMGSLSYAYDFDYEVKGKTITIR